MACRATSVSATSPRGPNSQRRCALESSGGVERSSPTSVSTLLERGARLGDDRLQLRVGVLPEVYEAAVVLARLGALAARSVQGAEPLQRRGERASVEGVEQHERSPHSRRGCAALVCRQRRVGLVGTLIPRRELEQPIGWVFGLLGPGAIPEDRVPHSPLGERNGCNRRELPWLAPAVSLGNESFVLGQQSPRLLRPAGLGVERGQRRVRPVQGG